MTKCDYKKDMPVRISSMSNTYNNFLIKLELSFLHQIHGLHLRFA